MESLALAGQPAAPAQTAADSMHAASLPVSFSSGSSKRALHAAVEAPLTKRERQLRAKRAKKRRTQQASSQPRRDPIRAFGNPRDIQ